MANPTAIIITVEPDGILTKWSVAIEATDMNGRPVDAAPVEGRTVGLAHAHDEARDVAVALWSQMKRAHMDGSR